MSEVASWRIAPTLGVRDVKKAVEYYVGVKTQYLYPLKPYQEI